MASARAKLVNAAYRAYLKPVLRRGPDVERARGYLNRLAPFTGRPPAGTDIRVVGLGSFEAERIVAPGADPSRVILYIPGGGFVIRSPAIHRALAARISREAGVSALLVFYRLAPEHPYPAALEDCLTAYRHLLDSGYWPSDVIISGDSAGGCLALATMLALRDRAEPLPAGAVMLSPITDLRAHRSGSRTTNAGTDAMLSMDATEDLHDHYVGGSVELLSDPLVSPGLGDLEGLPPLLFQASDSEILLDDSVRTAERARAAGVECEVEVFSGVPHVWHAVPHLPESKRALASIAGFIRRTFAAARPNQRKAPPCTTPM